MAKLTNKEILSTALTASPLAVITKSELVSVTRISQSVFENIISLFSLVEIDRDFYGNKETGVYMTLNTYRNKVSLASY